MKLLIRTETLHPVALLALLVLPACSGNSDSTQPSTANEVSVGDTSTQPSATAPSAGAPSSSPTAATADSGRRVPPGVDTGKGCGGFLGDTCKADEYCAYEPGQHCGAADASSTCKPRPQMCTKEYRPVCGCDNKTYATACTANAAGQGVLSLGACSPNP